MMTDQCPHWSGHQPANVLRVPSQYPSIQSGVDAASYGDTVYVEPGLYYESVQLKSGIRLVGAGAWQTTIDGAGLAQTLIDFTDAHDVLIRGFRLRGVGLAGTCGPDVFDCSGNWYAAAIYADGDGQPLDLSCEPVSAVITQNIITDNAIGMMVSFHAQALVRNNLFVGNDFGLVANHLQDRGAALNNVFWQNGQLAIALDAAYVHMFHNLVAHSALGLLQDHVQHGIAMCNIFHDAPVQPSGPWSPAENETVDPGFISPSQLDFRLTAASPAANASCFDTIDWDSTITDLGAFGTFHGNWFEAPIEP